MALQRVLRGYAPSLLLPFCVWEHEDNGKLRLCTIECLEHWIQRVSAPPALSAMGLKTIAAALVARHKKPTFGEALSRRTLKLAGELIGPGLPSFHAMAPKVDKLVTLPGLRRDQCWTYRCQTLRQAHALFCEKCLAEARQLRGYPLERLAEAELQTPARTREMYTWTFKHLFVPGAPLIAAAALYFQAHAEPAEVLRTLGRQLRGTGLDELCMVAAGMRPVGRGEIGVWARYFYWLQGHAEVHALNAVRLVGNLARESIEYKRVLSLELAVYGIITDSYTPNPVSAVATKEHGAWSYRELKELGGFAEGAVVKLDTRPGYALFTALYAALVLTGAVAHTFTWAVVKPGYVAESPNYAHTFDGLGLGDADRRALETLTSTDTAVVHRAGLLSWSGLYAFVTRCKATLYFVGSPPFADIAVFDERLQRHVGGPFALLVAVAGTQNRILPRRTKPKVKWDDLHYAMGETRAGLCAKCGKSHAMEFETSFYYPGTHPEACTESAVTNGSTVAVLATAGVTRVHQLLDAAKDLAKTL